MKNHIVADRGATPPGRHWVGSLFWRERLECAGRSQRLCMFPRRTNIQRLWLRPQHSKRSRDARCVDRTDVSKSLPVRLRTPMARLSLTLFALLLTVTAFADLRTAQQLAWEKRFAESEAMYRQLLAADPQSQEVRLGLAR